MKNIKKLLLLLLLIAAGVQSAQAGFIYSFKRDTVLINNVSYELLSVKSSAGFSYTFSNEAYVIGMSGSSVTIPVSINYGGTTYEVKTVGQHVYYWGYPGTYYYDREEKKWLDSETSVGFSNSNNEYLYDDDIKYSSITVTANDVRELTFLGDIDIKGNLNVPNLSKLTSEAYTVLTGTLTSSNLTEMSFNQLNCKGKFDCPSLQDVYFLQGWNVFFSGQWEDHFPAARKGKVTAHVYDMSELIMATYPTTAVWCDFKQIINHKTEYNFSLANNSTHKATIYPLGTNSYSEAVAQGPLKSLFTISPNSSISELFKLHENYFIKILYDAATQDIPTLKRNGEEVTLTDVSYGEAGYEETNVNEDIRYVVTSNYKHCRLGFNGSGAVAGNYEIKRDGKTYKGQITNGFVDCDYGTTATLTMPATPYLLKNSLKLTVYSSPITTQNITLPTLVDGVYTINITIPSVSAARFEYAYDIPTVVNEDPRITLIRMGEGEVTLNKFWEWDDQAQRWRNEETLNCIQSVTRTTLPYPSSLSPNGWGFTLTAKPLKGQSLREFLIGRVTGADNSEGRDFIYWKTETPYANYDEATNTYTFTVDLENSINDMEYGMQDLDIIVDMGPLETIVEEGNKQTFLRQGGTAQVYLLYEDNATEYDPEIGVGTTNIVIPDHSNVLDCTYADLYINKVYGEKFRAYRDGVDVTSEFTSTNTQYYYDFDSADKKDNHRQSSVWTLIFEKDEKVVTAYDWTVVGKVFPDGAKITAIYEDETQEWLIAKGMSDIQINAGDLKSVRFDIPAIDGFTPMLTFNGMDKSGEFTLDNNIYSYTMSILQMADGIWMIGSGEVTGWTVVKAADVEDAEVRVSVEGGEEETISLTDALTEIDVTKAEYAQLRVKGSVSSSTYDLYLNAYDYNQKLAVIKAVKAVTGLGLIEAKAIVDSNLPVKVMSFEKRKLAEAAKDTLMAVAGTECSIIKNPSAAGSYVKVLCNGVDVTEDMTTDGDYLMMNIDAADLTRTTWVVATEKIINAFDVNSDGEINVSDVTSLVNKILHP